MYFTSYVTYYIRSMSMYVTYWLLRITLYYDYIYNVM